MDESSTLQVKYQLSDAWRNEQFVATGSMPGKYQQAAIDMTTATPEQRAAILRLAGPDLKLDLHYSGKPAYDGEPTIGQLAADCARLADAGEARERARLAEDIRRKISLIGIAVERQEVRLSDYQQLLPGEIENARRLGLDLAGYEQALAGYKAQQAEFIRRDEESKARHAQAQAEEATRQAEARAAAEAAKRAWIADHGSDYLRRACLDHGYDCQRRYAIERAALEAPGYTIDIEDAAEWRSRSCPSEKALDVLEAAKALGIGDSEVVWLTAAPADARRDEAEDDYPEAYEPREAVVIRGYLGRYDLVREL